MPATMPSMGRQIYRWYDSGFWYFQHVKQPLRRSNLLFMREINRGNGHTFCWIEKALQTVYLDHFFLVDVYNVRKKKCI